MPPFSWWIRREVALIRAGLGWRDVGEGPRAPQGELSQMLYRKRVNGWRGDREREREGRVEVGALSLAEFLLRWAFHWDLLPCQEASSSE